MLKDEQVESFRRDGFVNAGPVLPEVVIGALSQALDKVIARGPAGFDGKAARPVLFRDLAAQGYEDDGQTPRVSAAPVWQIVNIWEAEPAFRELIFQPVIVEAISRMTGFGDLQIWHDQVQYKPANIGGATGWHQDAPLWPSIEPMTPVSAWVPLDDADEANGCMWMVPGSQAWGNQMEYLGSRAHLKSLPDFADIGKGFEPPVDALMRDIRAVPCPVRRGEVHFHHSLTWHGSPENRSSRPRRAVAIHYMTSEARYTGRPHPMQPFIQVAQGEPMSEAGPHFPVVCRGGRPMAA